MWFSPASYLLLDKHVYMQHIPNMLVSSNFFLI